jgi:hypothetical protein
VIDAPPWMVSVEQPEMAAASSSESSDFAVPGSPTSIRPRFVARLTMARSTSAELPTNFFRIFSASSPAMKRLTACSESRHPGGRG